MSLTSVVDEALVRIREESQKKIYRRDPEAWYADVLDGRWWSKQKEIAWSFADPSKAQTMTVVKSCNGIGKDLPLDTPLPTPTGWTTMGEVQPGDYLLDESGVPTRVLTKSKVFTDHKMYRVTFNDGSSIVASDTHQWDTLEFLPAKATRQRMANRGTPVTDWRDHWDTATTKTTEDIKRTLTARNGKKATAANHIIPNNKAFELPEANLPVDPYILGAWLGDGASSAPQMTIGEDGRFLIREFEVRGVTLTKLATKYSYSFTRQGFRQAFRDLGVLNNKHIPTQYLRGSREQRLELLRGIMDTDGFHHANASCGIDLMNENLARGVAELIRTLGSRVSFKPARTYLNGRDAGTRYRMFFTPDFDPFTPGEYKSRKMATKREQQTVKTIRTVVSVEEVPSVPSQCVSVDSPRNLYLAGESMIPTHNTAIAGDLATWLIATNDPMELSVIATAPIFSQIGTGLFRYINDNYNAAREAGFVIPGRFVADPAIKVERLHGGNDKAVMQAKRPADNNLISSFQGIHDGVVAVFMDEAGGLPEDLWIGANAVTTNEVAKILAIGNPDELHTAFHARFQDRERYRDWNTISISAYDSPNLTGEIIHPNPVKDAKIKSHLVQKSWVEMMERQAHPNVVLAKVHGEFPKDSSTSFFPQTAMTRSYDTVIEHDSNNRILGVDLAFGGEDSTWIYENSGGHIRAVEKILYDDDFIKLARQIHNIAIARGAQEVRIDAGGTGKGVFSILDKTPEFAGYYTLIGLQGGMSAPDNTRWAQLRAYMYDDFRRQMQEGLIDLDYEDKAIRDQMQRQTYKINNRGAIQITPKQDMRSAGLKSPDELDAAIMAAVDLSWILDKEPEGAIHAYDRHEIPDFGLEGYLSRPGVPMF